MEKNYIYKAIDTSLRVENTLFSNYTSIIYWKISVSIVSYFSSSYLTGSSSSVIQLNKLPYGGTCFTDLKNGTALYTYITVYCNEWKDTDGVISKYVVTGKISEKFI